MSEVTKRGDTLLEVVFAFVMFSIVTVIVVSAMSNGITHAEASLELTLARTEIDTQSETLRFIQSAFANNRTYNNLWHKITERALIKEANGSIRAPDLSVSNCNNLYDTTSSDVTIYNAKAFVINSRMINDGLDDSQPSYYGYTLISSDRTPAEFGYATFATSSLNPRLVYTNHDPSDKGDGEKTTDDTFQNTELYTYVARAEGIYDFVVADQAHPDKPYFYDFYIYTCWYSPGADRPTTIGTVTRLYNPEFNKL